MAKSEEIKLYQKIKAQELPKKEFLRNNILKKFMYNHKLKYNEIWDKKWCSSSNFDYHLKLLITEGIIEKIGETYHLTNSGTLTVTEMDGLTIKNNKKPVICSFIVLQNDKDEILANIRTKQPFIEYLGVPGGKIELGNFSDEEALRELKEETGLSCDVKLKLIIEMITIDNLTKETKHHIIGYCYLGKNPQGELIKQTREGQNFWLDTSKIKDYKRFDDLDYTIPKILEKNDKIIVGKITRYQQDNKFTEIKCEWFN